MRTFFFLSLNLKTVCSRTFLSTRRQKGENFWGFSCLFIFFKSAFLRNYFAFKNGNLQTINSKFGPFSSWIWYNLKWSWSWREETHCSLKTVSRNNYTVLSSNMDLKDKCITSFFSPWAKEAIFMSENVQWITIIFLVREYYIFYLCLHQNIYMRIYICTHI